MALTSRDLSTIDVLFPADVVVAAAVTDSRLPIDDDVADDNDDLLLPKIDNDGRRTTIAVGYGGCGDVNDEFTSELGLLDK